MPRNSHIVIAIIVSTIFFASTVVQGQIDSNKVLLTVIKYDNQNPDFEYKTDTLLKDTLIDLSKTKVDLFFTQRQFLFPYYMPTGSFFKSSAKEKECNSKIYPNYVKCYAYDSLNRVIDMRMETPATRGHHYYKYDEKSRVIEVKRDHRTITISYNSNNTINEIQDEDGKLQKQFYFIYKTAKQ